MKCENCGKELAKPLIIKEINIEPASLFIDRAFCDDNCIGAFIRKNIRQESLGMLIHYKT